MISTQEMIDLYEDQHMNFIVRDISVREFVDVKQFGYPQVKPIEPVSLEHYQIIRLALFRIPLPTIYLYQDIHGGYEFIRGEEYMRVLSGAINYSTKADFQYVRRLREASVQAVIFQTSITIEIARELVGQITKFATL